MKTLIRNGWLLTLDSDSTVYDKGYVLIEDDRISEIGQDEARQFELGKQADEVLDADGKLFYPD